MNRKDGAANKSSGFIDQDLKTDDHDEIMIWLDKFIDDQKLQTNQTVRSKKWECPIIKGRDPYQTIVGYIDMMVGYGSIDEDGYTGTDSYIGYEVKSKIKNIGEVIRQIRQYQTYTGSGVRYIIVCPDDRFKDILESQGIGFLKSINPSDTKVKLSDDIDFLMGNKKGDYIL